MQLFCRPDNYKSITKEEEKVFDDMVDKLYHLLREQLERLGYVGCKLKVLAVLRS